MPHLRSLFRRAALDREIHREIQAHLEMEIEHRVKQGMSLEEARRTALRDFGGVDKTREEVRDVRGIGFLEVLWQDVQHGTRALRRSSGYTIAAVVILALGIGANTAMFSLIEGVLLKPLPFRDQDRITLIHQSAPGARLIDAAVSIPELITFRQRLTSMRDLVEYHQMSFTLLSHGEPSRVLTGVVSGNFFSALGVAPLYGRSFTDADAALGAVPVVLLSYGYWQETFGGDAQVVGTVVRMNDKEHTIVGVLPAFPQYPDSNDIYMPTSACPFRADSEATMAETFRSFSSLAVFGWLRDGVTTEQASAEIQALSSSFPLEHSKDYPVNSGFTGFATPLREDLVRDAKPMLLALSGATFLVLIIACANVANLALARALRRGRELAVRSALGASRGRLVRQLVTESLLVSLIGGGLGLLLARVSLLLLVPFLARFTSRTGQIDIDGGVLAFALVASVLTGLLSGVLPALSASKSLVPAMREGAAQGGESRSRRRLRAAMVVAQVSVSFVLLIGATLLLSSVYRMATTALGFDTDRVMTATVSGNFSKYQTPESATAFYEDVLGKLSVIPGVTAAAVTNVTPLSTIMPGQRRFKILGMAQDRSELPEAIHSVASADYFKALGVSMLRGRSFNSGDRLDSMPVVIINAAMAAFWHGRDPIGSYIMMASPNPNNPNLQPTEYLVVGVVPNFQLHGPVTGVQPESYRPVAQVGFGGRLLVRTAGDPDALAKAIRDAVHEVDAEIPVGGVETLQSLKREGLSAPALTAGLLSAFAGVALVISLAGIAGLIGTAVNQRTREFGVRLALGGKPWSIVATVVRQGVLLVGIGVIAGAVGGYFFSRVIARDLFQTTPTDATAYAAAATLFLLAGGIAAFVPAKRITRINPLTVLGTD